MKTLLIGLLQSLGGWLATAAVLAWLLHRFAGTTPQASIGFALLMGVFVWAAIGLFKGAIKRLGESAALRKGGAAQAPRDGRHTVLVGRIEPIAATLGAPLTAPLDGAPCVMYAYTITFSVGSGKQRRFGTIARGTALVACRIVTASGSHKLLAVPDITGTPPGNSRPDQLARFTAYARRTAFIPSGSRSADELLRQWADDDGNYRADVAYTSFDDIDTSIWNLQQQQVAAGATVCVFGRYAKARGGIVPTAAAPVRVMVGPAAEIAATLRRQAINWIAIGLVLLAVPAVIVWANR